MREKKTERVSLRLPPGLKAGIEQLAKAEGRSVNDAAAILIRAGLKRRKVKHA